MKPLVDLNSVGAKGAIVRLGFRLLIAVLLAAPTAYSLKSEGLYQQKKKTEFSK